MRMSVVYVCRLKYERGLLHSTWSSAIVRGVAKVSARAALGIICIHHARFPNCFPSPTASVHGFDCFYIYSLSVLILRLSFAHIHVFVTFVQPFPSPHSVQQPLCSISHRLSYVYIASM